MTAEQFCLWLQGYLDISKATQFGEEQTLIIKASLSSVFCGLTIMNGADIKAHEPKQDFRVIYLEDYFNGRKPPSA